MAMRLLPFIIISVATAVLHPAWARSQRISLRFAFNNEIATLRHPGAEYFASSSSWAYIPRLGLNLAYETSTALSVGVGPEVSVPSTYMTPNASYQYLTGNLYARYLDVLLPLTATVNFAQGIDWRLGLKLSAGPSFERWQTVAIRSSKRGRLPLTETSEWYSGFFGQVGLLGEGRPSNWSTILTGPYVGLDSRRNLSFGLVAQFGLL
jgi:hypothetical protein